MQTTYYSRVQSPVGPLLLVASTAGLHGVHFEHDSLIEPGWIRDDAFLEPVARQLTEYFAGDRRQFDLPLDLKGTPFQRSVWSALCDIPYGTTISYKTLAQRIDSPQAVRAVGLANGRNPVAIVVPCHRVIGADGSLTGYGGGLPRKRFLLDLEAGDRLL